MWQHKLQVSIIKQTTLASYGNDIVSYCLYHVVTQDPGHSTKIVTLPSSILL